MNGVAHVSNPNFKIYPSCFFNLSIEFMQYRLSAELKHYFQPIEKIRKKYKFSSLIIVKLTNKTHITSTKPHLMIFVNCLKLAHLLSVVWVVVHLLDLLMQAPVLLRCML